MEDLIAAARKARANAYAPYSVYSVGAAVQSSAGAVYAGCNVENGVYGLAICAERSALCQMVAAGEQTVVAVCIITEDGATPCGACRQFIAEFADEELGVKVVCCDESGNTKTYTLAELLPNAFKLSSETGVDEKKSV